MEQVIVLFVHPAITSINERYGWFQFLIINISGLYSGFLWFTPCWFIFRHQNNTTL